MLQNLKKFLQLTPQDLKQPVILKQKGQVFYMLLNTKANAFDKQFVRQINSKLDIVEQNEGATALVTTSLSKMFSGGLNLKYISDLHNEDKRYFVQEFIAVLGRITGFPMPTISLVRGGAVAGGCMLAFAHDYLYVGGNALFQTNQSQNQMQFPPGMMGVIRKRHAFPSALRDMVVLSKKFQAQQALENKFIDGIWKEEEAVQKVHQLAESLTFLGYNKENMKKIKFELHKDVINDCFNRQQPFSQSGYNPMSVQAKL